MKIMLIAALALLTTSLGFAHPVAQGQLELEWQARALTLRVRVSDEQITVASTRISPAADTLDELWADHGRYLLARLQLHADAQRLSGEVTGVQRSSGNFVEYRLRYALPQPASELRLQQDLLNEIEYAAGNPWEASYIVNVRGQGAAQPLLLRSRGEALSIPVVQAGIGTMARQFLQHGLEHDRKSVV